MRTKRGWTIWLIPFLFLVSLVSWSVSSPAGSSPDDDFHLASIWCGLGDRPGLCESTGDAATRLIPQAITTSAGCYAYHPEISASCVNKSVSSDLVEATRGNFQGLYPPVFYAVTALFASPDVSASAVVIRIVNSILLVGLVTLLYVLLPAHRRPTLIWSVVISSIPLGLFIFASDNPSSWALISAAMLWLSLVGYFESVGRRRIGLGVLALIAVVMGAGSRADSAAYSVLAAIVAVILTARRTRSYLISAVLPLVVSVVAVAFYLAAGQGASAAGGIGAAQGEQGTNPFTLFAYNLLNVPALWAGVFGSYGLGWLDTAMPGFVSIGALFVFVVLLFAGLAYMSWRKAAALILIVGGLVAIPTYVLTQSNAIVGAQVQPRYILPLIIMLGAVALVRVDDRALRLSFGQRYFAVGLLALTQAIALHFNFRRYLTGLDVGNWNLNSDIEWWWGGPVSPMAVWIIGSLAFAAAVVLVARRMDPMVERGSYAPLSSPAFRGETD